MMKQTYRCSVFFALFSLLYAPSEPKPVVKLASKPNLSLPKANLVVRTKKTGRRKEPFISLAHHEPSPSLFSGVTAVKKASVKKSAFKDKKLVSAIAEVKTKTLPVLEDTTPQAFTSSLKKYAENVTWRESLSKEKQALLDQYERTVAFDDVGVVNPPGSAVKNTLPLLEQFSPVNQAMGDITILKQNAALIKSYVGDEKQFSDMQLFVDALDKERIITDTFLKKTFDATAKEGLLADRDAYDTLIKHIGDNYQKKPLSESVLANASLRENQRILTGTRGTVGRAVYGSTLLPSLRTSVQKIQKHIDTTVADINNDKALLQKYQSMVDIYQANLLDVKRLYKKITETPYKKINPSQLDEYREALNKLKSSYQQIQSEATNAQKVFNDVHTKHQKIQNSINGIGADLRREYTLVDPEDFAQVSSPIVEFSNQLARSQVEGKYTATFLKQISGDSLSIYQDLLHGLEHRPGEVDWNKKIKKKWISRWLSDIKKWKKGTAQPLSNDCVMFEFIYRELRCKFDEIVIDAKNLQDRIQGITKDSRPEVFQLTKEELKGLVNTLNFVLAKAKGYQPREGAPLALCFLTFNRIQELFPQIEDLGKVIFGLQESFAYLEESVSADKKSQ